MGKIIELPRLLLQTVKNNDRDPGGRKGESAAGLRIKDNILNKLHQATSVRGLARPLLIDDPREDPAVAEQCKILIADRNRHVREFLRRELRAEGYRVEVAGDGREVLKLLESDEPPHLLILDLEIPNLDELEIWARLQDRQPPLPVVVHTFLPEYPTRLTFPMAAAFLEKQGDTDHLKGTVAEVLEKHYPRRFIRVRTKV